MKKYKQYISKAIAAILLGVAATGCSDYLGFDNGDIDEGAPVMLSIDCAIGDMPAVSRADMTAGRDVEINSMWVAFFSKDGKKKHEFTFDNVSQVNNMDVDFPELSGLNLTSGEYYLMAVANPAGNRAVTPDDITPSDLLSLLKSIESIADYKKIAVYSDPGSVGTPTGNLVMQGIYLDPNTHIKGASSDFWAEQSNNTVKILSSTTKLSGAIHFRRLISQVKFNISYDTEKFSSFEPVSMTIFNVPTYSWLCEHADGTPGNSETNAGDNIGSNSSTNFTASQRFYNFTKKGNEYAIDWYQMENRRQAVSEITKYSERENERKENNLNTGLYIPLCGESGDGFLHNNNASFAVVNARLALKNPPQGVASRMVEATYTIHLGFCEGNGEDEKSKDYNCRRNTKYTYNVKVNDINKIEVEAKKETVDYEHGAEGIITDITNDFFETDCHFEQRNVYLTSDELKDLKWTMRVYTDYRNFLTIDETNYTTFDSKYWDWIEFIPTTGSNVCATYNPQDAIKLSDMKGEEGGYYTMFIDEYIYENNTTENNATHGSLTPDWKSYVNLPDRIMWLKVEENRSSDGESVIVSSKYAVRQKSLQTYYGTGVNNPNQALALEHVNETEGLTFTVDGSNDPSRGGRYQTAESLGVISGGAITSGNSRPRWSRYLNQSGFLNGYGVSSINSASLTRLCLNRNRDLNGDGRIDASEMRWFVPSLKQYVRFVMGSQSLSSPLYDYSDKTQGSSASYYHYGSSEGYTLWAEEYMSTANGNNNIAHVRCARYLGVDMSKFDETPATPAFVKRSGKNEIEFHYNQESLRDKTTSPLPWHYVNSEYNRPYTALEYKSISESNIVDYNASNPFAGVSGALTVTNWFANINNINPCDKFNTPESRGWRVPNQVELTAIMYSDNLQAFDSDAANRTRYITVTREFYSQGRIMGTTTDIATAIQNSNMSGHAYVLCVRDIE